MTDFNVIKAGQQQGQFGSRQVVPVRVAQCGEVCWKLACISGSHRVSGHVAAAIP